MPDRPPEPTITSPRTTPREETHTRRVPPYHVVLANDDDHSMDFVMNSLKVPGPITVPFGCASCVRITSASTPAAVKNANAVAK